MEPGDSGRRGNYSQVLHLLAEKDHLDKVTLSQCVSSDTGKDPIDSVVKYQFRKFRRSVDALFVAAVMAETVDIGINLNQQEFCALCLQTVRSAVYLCDFVMSVTTELLLVGHNICSATIMN